MTRNVSVLFVCMGNICRSPTAEGVFRHLVEQEGLSHRIRIDSAGTHAYHVGEPPDRRAQATAKSRGVDLSQQRARKVVAEDFRQFQYILAMDENNLLALRDSCPADGTSVPRLFLEFAPHLENQEVPDPYYGGSQGFDLVFELVEAAAVGLLADIRKEHL